MQRSCLTALILIAIGLNTESLFEISPMSMQSAIEVIKNKSEDDFKNALAYFSLGLDEIAFKLSKELSIRKNITLNQRVQALLLSGITAYRLANWTECVDALEKLESLNVKSPSLRDLKIVCQIKSGNSSQVEMQLEDVNSLDFKLLATLLELRIKEKNHEEALKLFRALPNSYRNLYLGGLLKLLLEKKAFLELEMVANFFNLQKSIGIVVNMIGINVETDLGKFNDLLQKLNFS